MGLRDGHYTGTVATVGENPGGAVGVDLDGGGGTEECSGCALASGACSRRQRVEARLAPGLSPREGDRVELEGPQGGLARPMLWGIVIPCLVLVGATAVAAATGASPNLQAGYALVAVAVWYLLLAVGGRRVRRNRQGWRIVAIKTREGTPANSNQNKRPTICPDTTCAKSSTASSQAVAPGR